MLFKMEIQRNIPYQTKHILVIQTKSLRKKKEERKIPIEAVVPLIEFFGNVFLFDLVFYSS